MRRILLVFLTAVLLLLLCACSGDTKNSPVSAGYLPTRMEQILSNPIVPEGAEATSQMTNSRYRIENYWGEWIRKDTVTEDARLSEPSFSYTATVEQGDPLELEFYCFPEQFSFFPDFFTNRISFGTLKRSNVANMLIGLYGREIPDDEIKYEHNPFGRAFTEQGLGFGTMDFEIDYSSMDSGEILSLSFENNRVVTYSVRENMLAVGLTDLTYFMSVPSDVPNETNICEINYTYSWTGTELTLYYGEKSAVYVPKVCKEDNQWMLEEAGPVSGMEPLDGMLGISLSSTQRQVMYDIHSGYTDSEIQIFEDGTMVIDGRTYQYNYSGDSLLLIGENGQCTYSNFSFLQASPNQPAYASFLIEDWPVELTGNSTMEWIVNQGFTTELDLNQMIPSCRVTEEIILYYGDTYITVKACNPYNNSVALRKCVICSLRIDQKSDTVKKGDGEIGKTTFDCAEEWFAPAYEKKPDYLRFKAFYMGVSDDNWNFLIGNLSSTGDGTKMVIDLPNESEVIYKFEGGILDSVTIEVPALMHNGLQDNILPDALEGMSTDAIQTTVENRDTVLDRLKKAFGAAGVDVQINEATGEIVLASNVLFGFDSYSLTDTGKQYIDSFMGVYASVVLDEALADLITDIYLEGHTDSSGSYSYNLMLSEKRAQAVLDYCLSSSSTSMNRDQKERLAAISSVKGYAFSDLVYDKAGKEDPKASRRVAIKFYVNPEADRIEKSHENTAGEPLGTEDFRVQVMGEMHDALTELNSNSAWYFYYDESNGVSRQQIVQTNRGIRIGDSVNDLLAAYGDAVLLVFTENHPLYDPNGFTRAMLDECVSYVGYWYGEEAAIYFFLDSWNCVSWIVFFRA